MHYVCVVYSRRWQQYNILSYNIKMVLSMVFSELRTQSSIYLIILSSWEHYEDDSNTVSRLKYKNGVIDGPFRSENTETYLFDHYKPLRALLNLVADLMLNFVIVLPSLTVAVPLLIIRTGDAFISVTSGPKLMDIFGWKGNLL